MNFIKLSKYFAGKLPNSEKMNISEFVKILGNLDIEGDFISEFGAKFGAIESDYEVLFEKIKLTENGENKILGILKYFKLSRSFLEQIDYKEEISIGLFGKDFLVEKQELLKKFETIFKKLNEGNNNKLNGNKFEDICEEFLLHSSYFEPGFKEFEFEDKTEKIDRLLKLKKDIGNFGKETNYLGYAILEAKYKKEDENGAGEVSQLRSYIERLNDYGVSKYAIIITSTKYKETYKIKIGDYCRKKVIEKNPFYISLLTVEEIIDFLKNEGNYKNMTFDDFIERSFIRWIK